MPQKRRCVKQYELWTNPPLILHSSFGVDFIWHTQRPLHSQCRKRYTLLNSSSRRRRTDCDQPLTKRIVSTIYILLSLTYGAFLMPSNCRLSVCPDSYLNRGVAAIAERRGFSCKSFPTMCRDDMPFVWTHTQPLHVVLSLSLSRSFSVKYRVRNDHRVQSRCRRFSGPALLCRWPVSVHKVHSTTGCPKPNCVTFCGCRFTGCQSKSAAPDWRRKAKNIPLDCRDI